MFDSCQRIHLGEKGSSPVTADPVTSQIISIRKVIMTIGIYALFWEEQDLVYVGQSQNIESRFREHISNLRKGTHTNYKVQEAFNKFKEPILVILEESSVDNLNDLEIYYTSEFDSINTGLNIIEAGKVGWGTNSNASVYSRLQILKVFSLLYKTTLTYPQISKRTKVSESSVADIRSSKSHLWLSEVYPTEYNQMITRISNIEYKTKYSKQPIKVIDRHGVVYTVYNIREFAREHNLFNTHLGEVIRGNRKSHKGWTLQPNTPNTSYGQYGYG